MKAIRIWRAAIVAIAAGAIASGIVACGRDDETAAATETTASTETSGGIDRAKLDRAIGA